MKYLAIILLAAFPFRCAQADVCKPNFDNTHSATASDGHTVAVTWCDDAQGTYTYSVAGTVAETAACIAKLPVFDDTASWYSRMLQACVDRPLNAAETVTYIALVTKWAPRLRVASGANRAVYLPKADGTRGLQWVNSGVKMMIAPGKPCKGTRLKSASARYHLVEWQLTVNGFTIPTNGGYALCQINFAPPTGW